MNNVIYHWSPDICKRTGYEQNQVFEEKELHGIIDHVLSLKLQVMIYQTKTGLVLAIDNGKFKQR